MVTPAAKREAVAHLQTALGMSERRACAVVGADRKSMRYRSCRGDDGDLRSRLRELAQQRRRFGYRRDCQDFRVWPGIMGKMSPTLPRRKEPTISNALLDQLLAGGDASAAFDQGGLLDALNVARQSG
ncbi:hypothetical protein ABIB28_001774 [Sphingomonas sp. UYEF23]